MNFGQALEALKTYHTVARHGWNGKNMYLYLVKGGPFIATRSPVADIIGWQAECHYRDHIDMRTAEGSLVPWVASQTDLLAEDWYIVAEY